mmetsp:Transcript_14569/g.40374  ORF Transcript_14569/g.40374 Transcript_14569/m.40374 type:complete len:286 (+) Transcript_14569:532-1389(+)
MNVKSQFARRNGNDGRGQFQGDAGLVGPQHVGGQRVVGRPVLQERNGGVLLGVPRAAVLRRRSGGGRRSTTALFHHVRNDIGGSDVVGVVIANFVVGPSFDDRVGQFRPSAGSFGKGSREHGPGLLRQALGNGSERVSTQVVLQGLPIGLETALQTLNDATAHRLQILGRHARQPGDGWKEGTIVVVIVVIVVIVVVVSIAMALGRLHQIGKNVRRQLTGDGPRSVPESFPRGRQERIEGAIAERRLDAVSNVSIRVQQVPQLGGPLGQRRGGPQQGFQIVLPRR